jgi:putative transcriptional regulator
LRSAISAQTIASVGEIQDTLLIEAVPSQLFRNVQRIMSSLQGHLLVASPKLGDPNFFRSVVLLVRHNEEGAFGVVLNRPSNTQLKDVWGNVSETPCTTDAVIHHGGPCEGPLSSIHTEEFLAEGEVVPNLYFSAGKDKIEHLVLRSDDSARFYAGYAGWSSQQLEAELGEGAWFTAPAKPEHAFWPSDDLWDKLSRVLASTTRIAGIKMKHEPPDPLLN